MLDTMTITKTVGALCGSLLIFLLGSWGADMLYTTGGGHGDHAEQAYVIDTGADDAHGGEAKEEGPDLATLMASADVAKGAKVFSKCSACHKLEQGANATGPYLFGVVNRPVDTAEGYTAYSGALLQVGDVWTPENLFAFLENPKGTAPGTKMSFAGLKKAGDRADLIAYLETIK